MQVAAERMLSAKKIVRVAVATVLASLFTYCLHGF